MALSASNLKCDLTIYTCVVNWLPQTVFLDQDDYQNVVNRLEQHEDEQSLQGVDGVWFILKNGTLRAFLNERAKVLDEQIPN